MLISYNWIKSYVPEIPDVEKVLDLITFHVCEIENVTKLENGDSVLDLKILPDRAHDLLSHIGLAKEIASLLGIKFIKPEYKRPSTLVDTKLEIKIEDSNCNRYMGRIIRNVKVEPSPKWMVQYLENVGQRSINNIVDATNIVMLGLGQPIHAFDLSLLNSEKIVVRKANSGESLALVGSDKIVAKLETTDMMITDGVKNLAIAGVKGGLDSGISLATKDILIEVANFDGVSVRKTARRLGIHTDASKRYENNLSPELCRLGMDEITALIYEMCKDASFEEVVDMYDKIPEIRKINFTSQYVSKKLGLKIPNNEIEKILENYNYKYNRNVDDWEITVPEMRLDITGMHDMVEEIGRVYGYDKITPEIPVLNLEKTDNPIWLKINATKNKFISDGYREVMTSVFTNSGELEILASASDKNFLRTNLSDGLKKSFELNRLNAPIIGNSEIKIFEIGSVFMKDKEILNVCFMSKKEIIEMSLDKFIDTQNDSFLSDFLSINKQKNESADSKISPFQSWSIYPFIVRDIAVWVSGNNEEMIVTNKDKLVRIYKEFGGEILIQEPILFDEFSKEGKTSLGYRLIFQSYDRTLTDEEINQKMTKINEKIVELGFEIR